jgi:hypothetical protein
VRGLEDADLPIVGAGEVRGSARGIPVEQNTTYWDVIYKIAIRVGLIAYVDGLDVVLSRPKTITDKLDDRHQGSDVGQEPRAPARLSASSARSRRPRSW